MRGSQHIPCALHLARQVFSRGPAILVGNLPFHPAAGAHGTWLRRVLLRVCSQAHQGANSKHRFKTGRWEGEVITNYSYIIQWTLHREINYFQGTWWRPCSPALTACCQDFVPETTWTSWRRWNKIMEEESGQISSPWFHKNSLMFCVNNILSRLYCTGTAYCTVPIIYSRYKDAVNSTE